MVPSSWQWVTFSWLSPCLLVWAAILPLSDSLAPVFSLAPAALALIHHTAAAPVWSEGLVTLRNCCYNWCSLGSLWISPSLLLFSRGINQELKAPLVGCVHAKVTLFSVEEWQRCCRCCLMPLAQRGSSFVRTFIGLWWLRLPWLWGRTVKTIWVLNPFCSVPSLICAGRVPGCGSWAVCQVGPDSQCFAWIKVLKFFHGIFLYYFPEIVDAERILDFQKTGFKTWTTKLLWMW